MTAQNTFIEQLYNGRDLKKLRLAGTHRLYDPTATYAKLVPRLKQFGITRVANVTGLDRIGLPVITVTRPNARSVTVSQGKGIDLDAARVSGVMEAIELFHAETIANPLVLASATEMRQRARIIDPHRLPPSHKRNFDPFSRILWIEGIDLMTEMPSWVPLDMVTTDATGCQAASSMFCSTSNGLASGNHLIEAACHGLCELIERDATTLWYLADRACQAARRLDLTTVADPTATAVLSRLAAAEIIPFVWDVTSDVGVAAFLCLLCEPADRADRGRYASTGMGCHPDRAVALLRALTEAAQSRLTLITGARDDVFRDQYLWNADKQTQLDIFCNLHPAEGCAWHRFDDVPTSEAETLGENLAELLARLRATDVDTVVAVDLSQPAHDIPVLRMVATDLEAPAAADDYAPGRRAKRLLESLS